MFKIAQKQEQYKTYILRDEQAQSLLEVVPERGALISRWQIKAHNILYLDSERFANPQLSVRGGIPILFPICGNLPNNTYSYQGQKYQLKQHGFARDLPWQIAETRTDDCASITLILNSNEQTLAVYPFEFQLIFTYELQGNSLKIIQSYSNHSQEKMPFSTGLHPYFQVEAKNQLEFDIPASTYQDQNSQEISAFTGGFDWGKEEIDLAFTEIHKHSTTIRDRYRNRKISIYYSDLYSTLVFWTIKGKNYVCLEPWSAPRNALNTGKKLNYLEPKSSCEFVVEMIYSHL